MTLEGYPQEASAQIIKAPSAEEAFEPLVGKQLGLELRRQLRTRSPGVTEMGYSALTPPEPFDRLPATSVLPVLLRFSSYAETIDAPWGIIMKPVVQLERTGCGIASVAAIAGLSYPEAKSIANSLGIFAHDESLWSDTSYVRKLLSRVGIKTGPRTIPFRSWEALPDVALLSIKWHLEKGRPYWHWAVFVRENGQPYVLDSKKSLRTNRRTDFGRMKPKWYIPVMDAQQRLQAAAQKAARR